MLSTSNKTKFQYQYLLVAVVIFAMASVIALYQSGVLPTISVGQAPATVDLSWPPRPDFSHLNENAIVPVTGSGSVQRGMEAYSARYAAIAEAHAAKVSAFHDVESARWMGAALASQAQATATVDLSWPPRPDFSHLNENAIVPVTGSGSVQRGMEAYSARYAAIAEAHAAKVSAFHEVESARWMGAALASQAQDRYVLASQAQGR